MWKSVDHAAREEPSDKAVPETELAAAAYADALLSVSILSYWHPTGDTGLAQLAEWEREVCSRLLSQFA
jgi:hypothetical protein